MTHQVDPDNSQEIVKAQRQWLQKLQSLNPNHPLRIKILAGEIPPGGDPDLYTWLPFVNIWHKVINPIYTRGILLNEILIDPDNPDWQIVREGLKKLSLFLRNNNIPFIMGFSGGKGIHVSIIFGNIRFSDELCSEIEQYRVDPYKTIRRTLVNILAERAGIDLKTIGVDWKKINFRITGYGSQVRTFGTIRGPGLYKTLIEKIPDKKPKPYELLLTFPDKLDVWEIEGTEYGEMAINALKNEVERAKKAEENTLIDADFSGIGIMKFPCIKKIFEAGIRNGRYYAGVSVLLMCEKCGISKEETEKHLIELFKTFPEITQAETDLRINNALTMYGGNYHFSCREVKESFGEDFCNFLNCPIKTILDEKKPNDGSYKELTHEEIQAQKDIFRDRRLPLILPPDHFVSIFCDWLSGLTDGYLDYMGVGGLWLISSFCAGKVEVRLKQETVKPNLYVMLFGKSTTSRKTTIVNRTRQIYESVTRELLPNEDFSIQGYLESLDKNPVQNHVRDEAAGFLAIIHKQYNEGFNEFECAVYDGQNFKKTLASKGQKEPKTFNIKNPYVTKLSATVFDNYLRYSVIEDFLSGREYRTLFVFPVYNKPSKPLGVETKEDIKNWTRVLERAKEIYLFIQQRDKIVFTFENEALEYYSKVTSELEACVSKIDNSMISSVVGRSQIHILKLAMLLELGKPQISTTLTRESIEIASKAVIDYFIPTIMDIIEQLQEDAKNNQVEKVIQVLRRNGGAVQHSKALHDSKLKSRDFNEVIETLIESETIEKVTEVKTKKIYYILKENKEKLNLSNFEIHPIPQILSIPLFSHDKEGRENLENLKNINKLDFECLDNTQNQQNEESLSCEIEHLKNNSILQIPSGNITLREYENSENWENRENLQSTQKSNDFSISTTQDVEKNRKSSDFSFSSPSDYMHDTLLIRDLTNFAKTYYHMVVENVNEFAEDFCSRNPGYKQDPGFLIVAEYSKKLKSRGWGT